MQEERTSYTNVLIDGLNQMEHEEMLKTYQEKGWTLFGATPDTDKMKMVYRFLKPKTGIRPV